MAEFRRFCAKVFSRLFRLYSIVKELSAVHCITRATIGSIFFSGLPLPAAAQPIRADLVLVNGDVRTLDGARPRVEGLAVADGKIIAVGSSAQMMLLADGRTRVIDAKGRLVLPGFNDAHVHFAAIGNKFSTIDLKTARTADEVAARFREYARFLPKGRWILGGGFDPGIAGGDGLIAAVEAATPDNPVFVYAADAQQALANRRATALAGLSTQVTEIGSAGGPGRNGILSGNELSRVAAAVPKDHLKNWPEVLETASNYAASLGVTSVQDMHSDELADVYRELDRAGKLKTRVYDCSPISAVPRLAAEGVRAASGTSMVRTGCVKTFSDGDEADLARLKREIASADKAGLQAMVHAIGPRANAIVLEAFEYAAKTNGRRDRRFRVEHAHNTADPDIPRFKRLSLIPSMQPWLFRGATAGLRRYFDSGARPAFGSDASMVEMDPLLGVYAASAGTRSIGVEEAVRAYTFGSAFAEFQEKVKGTIEVGKLADIVVLSDNIFARNFSRRSKVVAHLTVVNGKVVYELDQP